MKVKGLRWWIIGLIALATIINYIDRSAINYLWPFIHEEFGIPKGESKQALAWITIFFSVAYAIGQTVTGKMMDAIGTRIGMAVSIIGWSISIALHSVARSLAAFSVFRAMLGISEAGNWPGATKNNAEWFPAKERAIAQGIFGAGASLGSVVAPPVIVALYYAIGWRATFIVIAVLGIVWLIPWLIVNKATPDKHPWITEEEQKHILSKPVQSETKADVKVYTWKQLLQFRNTWGIISSRFFIDPIWWMFITWLPTFLNDQFKLDLKAVGAFAWLPYLFAAIGGLSGGFYSSGLVKRGVNPLRARKRAITIGAVIMLLSLGTIAFYLKELNQHINLTIGLISAALFGFQFLINNLQTLPSDYFHGKNVGTVSGMGGTAAMAGTIVLTFLVPVITAGNQYKQLFVLVALLVPIAWLCITFITSKTKTTLTRT
jgi:ACS family hexuronate transporter-like MFS transporter